MELKRTLIKDTIEEVGKEVLLKGWVFNVRDHGKVVFLDLQDRSGVIQAVGDSKFSKLHTNDVVQITGKVAKRPEKLINPNIETGTVELQAEDLKVIEKSEELPFDITAKELNVELPLMLDYRSLSLRHPKIRAIFKIQETVINAFRNSLVNLGFTEFQAPTIVPTATEGGAQVFPVQYYKYGAYLCQSPQLYKQIMVGVFERVFSIARAYRAEPSVTTRHLSEYVSLDAELGFIDSYEDVMDVVEIMVKDIFGELSKKCEKELKLFNAEIPKIKDRIPRIKMREAQEIIFERTGRDNRKEPDLMPDDEKEICKWALENHGSELIFITHFPMSKRPFYTYPDPKDPEYSLSFDMLGRGLEWVTGGQRLNNYSEIVEAIKKRGNDPMDFDMYLQAFKYGMPPEGGFALGAERITMQVLGLENIREASLFPRDMERVDFRLATRKKKVFGESTVFDEVLKLLKENKVDYKLIEHEAVKTSEEASKVRGTPMDMAPKAMIFKKKSEGYLMVAIPADKKVNIKEVEKAVGEKVELASPEEVEQKFGVKVGAVPPFGNVLGLELLLDKDFWNKDEVVFNAGRRDRSIQMKAKDFIKIAEPLPISKESDFKK